MATGTPSRRLVVYALEHVRGPVDDYVLRALTELRPHADTIVISAPATLGDAARESLLVHADAVAVTPRDRFAPVDYLDLLAARPDLDAFDEIVLTGDAWFGMVHELSPVLSRMAERSLDAWNMVEALHGPPPGFPGQGFPAPLVPWSWVVLTPAAVRSGAWESFWSEEPPEGEGGREWRLLHHLRRAGLSTSSAFAAADYPSDEPAIFSARRLISDGCPIVSRLPFRLFPPFLDQHGVIGAELLADVAATGFPVAAVLQSLSRTVHPKALNTNAGLLEVIPARAVHDTRTVSDAQLLVIVHVSDFDGVAQVLDHVARIPVPYDVVFTTTDGMRATRLQAILDARVDIGAREVEIRVTPDDPGRDMSDMFVGCRDLLLSDRYELVVKVHARSAPTKTVNRLRYFRRYQLENLLSDSAHIARIIELFRAEPGLGMMFPPMMHIGYTIAGGGWAGLERTAGRMRQMLGIQVPVDLMSPLAPFGGMWIARPAAMRRMAAHPWRYSDYRGRRRAREIAHVQERLLVEAAAEDGFHVRTVFAAEHAAIAHTALEFKLDEMGRAVRGYPLDQILFLHAAGPIGGAGPITLARMYLRLNHPRLARLFLPFYRAALLARSAIRFGKEGARRVRGAVRPRGEVAS